MAAFNVVIRKADDASLVAIAAAEADLRSGLSVALDTVMRAGNLDEANRLKAEIESVGTTPTTASTDRSKNLTAASARRKYEVAVQRAKEDRMRTIETARKVCLGEMDNSIATALKAKDLDKANRIKVEEDQVKKSGFGEPAPIAALSPALKRVDLLALVNADHDGVKGGWSLGKDSLICESMVEENTLRLPYRPPAEYDFVVEFTVDVFGHESDVAQICSAGGHSFLLDLGAAGGRNFGFSGVAGRLFEESNPDATRALPPMQPGRRYRAVVQVRKDNVRATLDDKEIAAFKTDFSNLDINGTWQLGEDVLGVGSCNRMRFQRIEVLELSGPGHVIARLDPAKVGVNPILSVKPSSAGSISLTDLKPISMHAAVRKIEVHREAGKVQVNGKPCDRWFFTHAPSSMLFDIPDGAVAFTATGTTLGSMSMRFVIYVDSQEMAITRSLKDSGGQVPVEIALPKGAKRIELRVDPMDGNANDHGVWAFPTFLMPAK